MILAVHREISQAYSYLLCIFLQIVLSITIYLGNLGYLYISIYKYLAKSQISISFFLYLLSSCIYIYLASNLLLSIFLYISWYLFISSQQTLTIQLFISSYLHIASQPQDHDFIIFLLRYLWISRFILYFMLAARFTGKWKIFMLGDCLIADFGFN